MGFLDDVLGRALPGGSGVAKPLMLAFPGAIGVGRPDAQGRRARFAPAPGSPNAGGLLGGWGGLLGQLQQGRDWVILPKFWIGNGQNQPISPGQIGIALGPSGYQNARRKDRHVRTGHCCSIIAASAGGRRQVDTSRAIADDGRDAAACRLMLWTIRPPSL